MAGEINSTTVIISNTGGDIVGQMECTVTFNGTPIDISNKSYEDWVTLMDGELAGKQLQVAGSCVFNSDATYKQVRADSFSGTLDDYTVTYSASGATLAASMMPNGLSDAAPHGDKLVSSFTLLSSGVVTIVPQTP